MAVKCVSYIARPANQLLQALHGRARSMNQSMQALLGRARSMTEKRNVTSVLQAEAFCCKVVDQQVKDVAQPKTGNYPDFDAT